MVVNKSDWRTIVKDKAAVRVAESRQRSRGTSATQRMSRVAFSIDVHPFLVRAAQLRGISISGYIRRATMARVAADLGLPARDLFRIDSAIRARGGADRDLDGERWGRWEVNDGH